VKRLKAFIVKLKNLSKIEFVEFGQTTKRIIDNPKTSAKTRVEVTKWIAAQQAKNDRFVFFQARLNAAKELLPKLEAELLKLRRERQQGRFYSAGELLNQTDKLCKLPVVIPKTPKKAGRPPPSGLNRRARRALEHAKP
jgi:hypothetical protein